METSVVVEIRKADKKSVVVLHRAHSTDEDCDETYYLCDFCKFRYIMSGQLIYRLFEKLAVNFKPVRLVLPCDRFMKIVLESACMTEDETVEFFED